MEDGRPRRPMRSLPPNRGDPCRICDFQDIGVESLQQLRGHAVIFRVPKIGFGLDQMGQRRVDDIGPRRIDVITGRFQDFRGLVE